jgi:hypothetical protein
MNVRQNNGVNRAVKSMSDNILGKQSGKVNKQSSKMNKQSSKMNVRKYNGVNRAVK